MSRDPLSQPPEQPDRAESDSRLTRLQKLRERIDGINYLSATQAALQDLLDVCVDQDIEIERLKKLGSS